MGKTVAIVEKGILVVKLGKSQPWVVNTTLIGKKSSAMTPLFLLTFEIINKNVHNYLVDSVVSFNVMSYVV